MVARNRQKPWEDNSETAEQNFERVQDRLRLRLQILLVVGVVVFVVVMLVKQGDRAKQLYKVELSGKVISVKKGNKGYYDVILVEGNKKRYIDFSYNGGPMISIGDSVYKKQNSDIYYVKNDTMLNFVKLDIGDASIGRKWE